MSVVSVGKGLSAPLGATVRNGGVNFSVFSRDATLIELLFFSDIDAPEPSEVIVLTAAAHRTQNYWHVFVPGARPGQIYAYRAHGPFAPHEGLRFDRENTVTGPSVG